MASLLQKLLKRRPPQTIRFLTSLNTRPLPQFIDQIPLPHLHPNPNPNPNPCSSSIAPPPPPVPHTLQIYPTFPYWIHSAPIPPPSIGEPETGGEGDDRTVWADSVKKKRKRKMNKHKLQKLRKSLRRKT